MHAYLIIGNKKAVDTKTEELRNEKQARIVEFPLAKVADVRDLNNFTKLKLTEKTMIVLRDFERASTEAQNAFLKSLEEPQENLIYVLVANNIDGVLPTIQSRSQILELQNGMQEIQKEDKEIINEFVNASVGKKLAVISKLTKRDVAIEFVRNLINVSHENFVENPELANLLEGANKTLSNLERNGNIQLQLTNFVVGTEL